MRLISARVFGLLALLGLAAWLSLWIMVAAVHFADVDPPEGDWGWTWIFVGWLGLMAAFLFGTLALVASRPAGPTGAKVRRVGLGLLGALWLFSGVALLPRGFAGAPVALAQLAVGAAALVVLWRDVRQGRGGE